MIGEKYNKLTIIEDLGVDKNTHRKVKCKCDCGNMVIKRLNDVKNGRVISCQSCSKDKRLSNKCKEIINAEVNDCTIINASYLVKENGRKRLFVDAKCNKCGTVFNIRYDTLKSLRGDNCPNCNNKSRVNKMMKPYRHTKLYRVYYAIKQRCYNAENNAYQYYGGRSVKMCDEWLNDFETFYKWAMNNGYKNGLQVDRINCNGNYEPNNCRLVNSSTNNYNKRNNILVLYKDGWRTIQYISDKEHMSWDTVYYRYVTKGKAPIKYLYGGGRIGGKSN